MAKKEQETGYGGYNHEFVGEIADRFNCQICTKVIREPHLAVCCGQHFCESCLSKWFTRQGKESCPHCRAEGAAFHHVINKGLRSEINQLKVKCSHHGIGKGCKWTGELGELKTHLESEKGCGFVFVECPNKCIYNMMRKDVEKHLNSECPLRPYQCEHCGLKDTYKNISSMGIRTILGEAHYDKCPAYPLACPNVGCRVDGIKRRDMANHRSKCPQELVECPFAEAGCKNTIYRHKLDNHVTSSMQQHLLLVMGAYKQMKDKLQETEVKLAATEATLTTAVQLLRQGNEADKEIVDSIVTCLGYLKTMGDVLTVAMPRVSEYHRCGKIWHSAPFYFKRGYKMCLAVGIEKMKSGVCTGISISMCLLKGEHDDRLKWPIGNMKCQPQLPPPLPLPWSVIPSTADAWFHMCSSQQLQQINKQLSCQKGTRFHLENDCLTFTVQYFVIYNVVTKTKSCDHLKVKVKCKHM